MSGWFDEQLRERVRADEEALSRALADISESLTGKHTTSDSHDALREIADFYGVEVKTGDDILKLGLLMHRTVVLKEGWYKDADGVYLAKTKDGNYAALIPGHNAYYYKDYVSGETIRINSSTQKNLEPEAECFYRPFPSGKLTVKDVLIHACKSLIPPYMTRIIYSHVINAGNIKPLFSIVIFIVSAGISVIMLQCARDFMISRIQSKTDVSVRAAVMMRLINLPVDFFKSYSSGELAHRAAGVNMLCTFAINVIFSAGLTAIMSLIYLIEIFSFSPLLVTPALLVMLCMLLFSLTAALIHGKLMKKIMRIQSKEQGIIFAFINGIQKIKLAGAERRAFVEWCETGSSFSAGNNVNRNACDIHEGISSRNKR